MGPEVDPLQRQLHRTIDNKSSNRGVATCRQVMLSCKPCIAISKIEFDLGVVVLLEICMPSSCLTSVLVLQSNK